MDKIELFRNKKEYLLLFFIIAFVFLVRILYLHASYLDLIEKNVLKEEAVILNIYVKKEEYILKLKLKETIVYIKTKEKFVRFDIVELYLITKNISFKDYLKGSFQNSFNINKLNKVSKEKKHFNLLNKQHENINMTYLYETLYFGYSLPKEIRTFVNEWGLAHLFAISGFHLGIIILFIMSLLYLPYKYIHQKYYPFRNRKNDLLLISIIFVFMYLIYIDFIASFLRAFIMFVIVYILSRNNIKLLSFKMLIFVLLIILSLFPKYIFSLSLWFSITAVFYIYLYLKYINIKSKFVSILFFNFWIFFVFNVISHFYFPTTSFIQLLSPFLTLVFSIFYPISLVLHLFNYGGLLDAGLLYLVDMSVSAYEFETNKYFFVFYLGVSIFSSINKRAFVLLNALLIGFNILLFYK